jgi:hypothetical protein
MQLIQQLYRKDLINEDVNVVGLYINDEWKYQKEELRLPQFKNLSDHAVVIGNGVTCNEFDLTQILPYRETTEWGEVGPWIYKRQLRNFFTYGCNAIYRNYKPDFVIATGAGIVEEIANYTHDKTPVIYSNSKNLQRYPGKFVFTPQNPEFNAGATAAYMAAFDGHKKVYLLGFDGIDSPKDNYNMFSGTANYPAADYPVNEEYWVRSLSTIMSVYSDTEFIRVTPTPDFRQPEAWKYFLNYRQINFRKFILEAGV